MSQIRKRLFLLLLAVCGAVVGYILNLPIGILIGSFTIVALAKIVGLDAEPFNKRTKRSIQMLIGGFVGLNMDSDLFPYLLDLIIPGLVATIAHFLFAVFFAYLLTKIYKFDWITALCGSVPAGMSEISNISDEIGGNTPVVMLFHLFRVSLLITILPLVIHLLL